MSVSSPIDSLIESLAKEIVPVKPLPRETKRAASFFLATLIGELFIFKFYSRRVDLHTVLYHWTFFLSLITLLTSWLFSIISLVQFQMPTTQEKKYFYTSLIFASSAALLNLPKFYRDFEIIDSPLFIRGGIHCSVAIGVLTFGSLFFLLALLRKGAPFYPTLTGLNAGLSAVTLAICLLQFSCPNDNSIHLLIWHMSIPLILSLGLSSAAGRLFLKW